jgi:hypothetical protein
VDDADRVEAWAWVLAVAVILGIYLAGGFGGVFVAFLASVVGRTLVFLLAGRLL